MKKPPAAGIPTAYKGVHFRSRLEATWAAFLDDLKVEWRYEPFDLKGYIPDFAIFDGKTLLEVKPVLDPHDFWREVGKIEGSGWTGRMILVGAEYPVSRSCRLGLVGEAHAWRYADATLLRTTHEMAEEAWKSAKNETQWFPAAPIKTPGKRRGFASHGSGEAARMTQAVEAAAIERKARAPRVCTDPIIRELLKFWDRPSLLASFTEAELSIDGPVVTVRVEPDVFGLASLYHDELFGALRQAGHPNVRKVVIVAKATH